MNVGPTPRGVVVTAAAAGAPAPRRLDAFLRRVVTTPRLFVPTMGAVTLTGLWLDSLVGIGLQLVLALCAWVILLTVCRYQTPERRAQVAVVVAVATCAEIIGSIIWGVYGYRLGNLPLFVPPGHGLVYLSGVGISELGPARRHRRAFVAAAAALVLGWALLGLTVLPRLDVAGAMGAVVLAVFLWRGRAPAVYAGVFLAVAFLEIYGTAIGTWRWAEEVPGVGIPDGNPPSGAASGYVLFDICALALAPVLLRAVAAVAGRRRGGVPEPAPGEA
ncbi:MAG: hypothetical protein AB1416_02620 [Actinomycetota bacterium]